MRKWIDIPVGTTEVVMYYRGANNYMPHFDEIPGWNIYRDGCPYNEDYQVFHPSPGQHLVSMVAVNAYDASIHPWGVYADIQVVVTVSVVPVQKTTWGMIKSLY